jgi:ABC-type nitrate/sulfonate/bicarbonate transport system substrate-binding protein
MNRRQWLCAASAGLAGCTRRSGQRQVRVSSFPGGSASGLYLARESGYFREAGIEVDIRLTTSTPQNIPLLAGRQLDASFGALNPAFLNAVAQGLPLKIAAVLDKASPECGGTGTIYGRRTMFPSGVMDLRLLKGRRVAVSARTGISGFFLDTLLQTASMTSDDVYLVELRQEEAVAALVGGGIDATVCSHRELELDRLSAKIVRGLSIGDVFPNLQYSFAVFGPTLLEGDPEIGIGFLAAYLRGAADYQAGKTPQFLGGDSKEEGDASGLSSEKCHLGGVMDEELDSSSITHFVDWAVGRQYCRQRPSLDRLVDTRFWQEARRRRRREA